jgi:hypothetical protein
MREQTERENGGTCDVAAPEKPLFGCKVKKGVRCVGHQYLELLRGEE